MSVTICGNFNIAANKIFTSINTTTNNPGPQQQAAAQPLIVNRHLRRNPRRNAQQNPRHAQRRDRRRLPLPSRHADPAFWEKIRNLPQALHKYLSPQWPLPLTTCYILRRIIWHFNPDLHIPCKMVKAQLLDIFEERVALQYGAYYGI